LNMYLLNFVDVKLILFSELVISTIEKLP
jgi:hypothetical protein